MTLKTAVGVVLSLFLGFGLDELSVGRAQMALDNVHDEAGGSTKPRLLVYGDSSNPVHENVPLALPELDVIVLPNADAQKFHSDELKSVIAHEYEHVQSHSPMLLTLVKVVLLIAPGILLVATGASPPARVFAGAVFATLVVGFAALALVTRLTDRHVADDEVSILTGATGQLYGSHPYPRRRVETLLTRTDKE